MNDNKQCGFMNVKVHNVEEVIRNVRNILLHRYWLRAYNLEKLESESVMYERDLDTKIKYLTNKGYSHITDRIKDEDKLVGICRDFSLFSVELLKLNNISARARCGFSTYLKEGYYIDHWVVEYWDQDYKMFDAQIDVVQASILNIRFPMTHVNDCEFILASDAWIKCRNKEIDASLFGIREWWGFDYLRINLILDANSLLGNVMYPWDLWPGYMSKSVSDFTDYDYKVFDELALIIKRRDLNDLEAYLKKHSIIVPKDERLISHREVV